MGDGVIGATGLDLWIALFKSESGDQYVIGPFGVEQSHTALRKFLPPEDAESALELQIPFTLIRLGREPVCFNLQMGLDHGRRVYPEENVHEG